MPSDKEVVVVVTGGAIIGGVILAVVIIEPTPIGEILLLTFGGAVLAN